MIKQNEARNVDHFVEQSTSQESASPALELCKKAFVEPEMSMPVDVIETTTFFQAATSGVTN